MRSHRFFVVNLLITLGSDNYCIILSSACIELNVDDIKDSWLLVNKGLFEKICLQEMN